VSARLIQGLALALCLTAAPAWAQGEAGIMQAVGKQLDAYTLCLKQQAHDRAKSEGTEEVIVDQALGACDPERQDLWDHLQMPPLNASPATATKAVKQLTAAMWPSMIGIIEAARAE
jgi:hypothetical protein